MRLTYTQARLMALATDLPQYMSFAAPLEPAHLSRTILRDYQLDILQRAAALFRAGYRRVLVVLPTGGGKTVLAGQALLASRAEAHTSHFWVHRKELIDQTSDSFNAMGLPHSFVAAKRPFDPTAGTLLAGVQTLVNRLDAVLPPNLIIVDEAHHAVAGTWAKLMDANPEAFVLGLTATPQRLDGRGLIEHFDVMIMGPTVGELIARGFLSPFEYYGPDVPDLTGVPISGSDYQRESLAEAMDKPVLIGNMVDHYLRLAKGQQGIVFGVNRQHSRNLAQGFRDRGVRAAHVDSDSDDREDIDRAFRRGELDIMTNVALFDEGYDVPGIVYVGDGAPTRSLVKFRQKVGRALRVIYGPGGDLASDAGRRAAIAAGPKPFGVIADHAGNAITHGLPDEDYEWSLTGRAKRARGACNADADPVRQCLDCYRIYKAVLRQCPGCGASATPTPREIEQREGELVKLEREGLKRAKQLREKAEKQACQSFGDFEALARQRGYPNPRGWAQVQMQMKTNYRGFRR